MSRQNLYNCSVCGEKFSEVLLDELIEHLRDHHANACEDADRSADQLEELGSHPEL